MTTPGAGSDRAYRRAAAAGALLVILALILLIGLLLRPEATLWALRLLQRDLPLTPYEECLAVGAPYCMQLLITPAPPANRGP